MYFCLLCTLVSFSISCFFYVPHQETVLDCRRDVYVTYFVALWLAQIFGVACGVSTGENQSNFIPYCEQNKGRRQVEVRQSGR